MDREKPNYRSPRDPDWHPRQPSENSQIVPEIEEPTLGLMARVELKQRITILFPPERVNELYRQEGLAKTVSTMDNPKPEKKEPNLDPMTKAELETHIAAHLPPERMEELFRQEGVSKKDSANRSLIRKMLDFLNL